MEKKEINMIKKKALIVCSDRFGAERIIRFFYFCKYIWNYNEVKITNDIETKYSRTILIDRKSIELVDISEKHKNLKFIICLWNGIFDYQNSDVQIFIKKLKIQKIDYKCFLPVILLEHKRNMDIIFPGKIISNNNCRIIAKKKLKFIFNNPNIYYLLRIFKSPKFFLKNLFQSKIIFVGAGILNDDNISIYLQSNIENDAKKIIHDFFNFSKKNDPNQIFLYMKNLIRSEIFLSLGNTRKFFLLHRIFRHILFSSLSKFQNFQFYLREYKVGLVRSSLYKNNYFLNLGSSAGFGIYDRTLQLFKHYKDRTINIEFFDEDLNFDDALNKLENRVYSLEQTSDKNLNSNNLKNLLKI